MVTVTVVVIKMRNMFRKFSSKKHTLIRAEMLLPTILLADGSSAVGTPMEMKYEGGVWTKGKQGELPGYRSSMTMVPKLKLGIFTSALVSDVEEVWDAVT